MSTQAHALLAPSGAERWATCSASVALEAGLPDRETEYQRYGTAAHELAALCLMNEVSVDQHIGQVMSNGETVDEEMAEGTQDYIEHVRALAEGHDLFIEQRVDLSRWIPQSFGTADAIILRGDGELIVCDLKMGQGVKVDATENRQLILYALGAYDRFNLIESFNRVRCIILQPRLHHISEWTCEIDTLWQHGERLKAAAHNAYRFVNGATPRADDFNPSEAACRFCRANGQCPAQTQFILNIVADDFVDLTHDLGEQLGGAQERIAHCDNAHLASLLPHLEMIEGWCSAVRDRAESELLFQFCLK
jgi:Protein of unknown function (DUF2800)